jgi:hypothetical protein
MGQLRSDLDFAQEPLVADSEGQLGLEDLQRDLAVVLPVMGEVDDRVPAAAELALDRVAVSQRRLQVRE